MKASCISNRNRTLLDPHKWACNDTNDWAYIAASGVVRLGHSAAWVAPCVAFSGQFKPRAGDWCIICPQPRDHNDRLLAFLRQNPQVHLALAPGGAQLDLLSQILPLVELLMLSIDRLAAATGDYLSERALLKLSSQNPGAIIVATSPQTALATQAGRIFRASALPLDGPPWGEGKSAAFLAGFLALLLETGDITQALQAGHANAAAVAQSWEPMKALCNRSQLEPFLVPPGSAPTEVGSVLT